MTMASRTLEAALFKGFGENVQHSWVTIEYTGYFEAIELIPDLLIKC
jgi:hypothetical protein